MNTCNVQPDASLDQVDKLIDAAAEEREKHKGEADKLGITPEKLLAMKNYAKQLMRSDPRMKTPTVRRKVCQKFKIKLT
jgi:hypothetical protein